MSQIVVLLASPARHVWSSKGSNETRDYGVDWSARLAVGDTIKASTFEFPRGTVAVSASHTDAVATVRISEGRAGEAYEVLNRVVTARGLTLEQAVKLRIKSK